MHVDHMSPLAEEGYDIGEPWLPQPFFFSFFLFI